MNFFTKENSYLKIYSRGVFDAILLFNNGNNKIASKAPSQCNF
jgi:hypothetical protein